MSIGIFELGFVISTAIGQLQGFVRERMTEISDSLLPAAQSSEQAQAAFHEARPMQWPSIVRLVLARSGMDGYVAKPISVQALLEELARPVTLG